MSAATTSALDGAMAPCRSWQVAGLAARTSRSGCRYQYTPQPSHQPQNADGRTLKGIDTVLGLGVIT